MNKLLYKMAIRIQLDNTLEKKTITNLSNLQQKSVLDLTIPDNYFSQYEYSERLIKKENYDYRTQNNFINTFLASYNFHKTLILRPDDIKLQILTIISICINNNPEIYRDYFVNHSEKIKLYVKCNTFSADFFCQKFSDLMNENIKDINFVSHYTSKFSTTNQIISTVNNITLMNTLKEYFSFSMMLCCGIPEVVLEGTNEDWNKLNETYQYFKSIFRESELKNWFIQFDKIMDLFMIMRGLKQIESINLIDNTKYIKEMWKRVISYIPQGSGDDKILGGWIRLFVPYNQQNKIIDGLDKELLMFDLTHSEPLCNENYYDWQDEMAKFYFGGDWCDMFSSFITTPLELIDYDDTIYNVEFYSGFYEPHITESDEIRMNFGYILREDKTEIIDKNKKRYLREGVIEKSRGSICIPKHLQKEDMIIKQVFNAYFVSYYGIDPEEEKRKEYYLNEGVKKLVNDNKKIIFSNRYIVPEKFKDNLEAIEEIKKLFNIYSIKYY
jgi:hypothetical protein